MASFSMKRFRLYAREVIAATLCLIALGIAAGVLASQIRPGLHRLTISGGSSEGLRSQIAERLAEEARSHKLILRLVPTVGSRETLDLLEARKLDLALVQGGLDPRRHPHVRQVAALHVEPLKLQRELGRLKNEALARFAEGKLEGEQLMSGFVSHVNDARNYLNRLILHERDNLEDRASTQKRPAAALWEETVGKSRAEPETPGAAGNRSRRDDAESLLEPAPV